MFLASVGVTNDLMDSRHAARAAGEGEEIFRRISASSAAVHRVRSKRPGWHSDPSGDLSRQRSVFRGFARAQFEQNGVSPHNLAAEGETGIPVNVTSAMLTPGDRTFATYCKPTAITDELLRSGIYHV